MSQKNRIIIADDQKLFADNLKSVLEFRAKDFTVVGLAATGHEAIRLVRQEKPDIVLMDIRMPGMGGVEATRIIHEEMPEVRIIVLTTFDDDEYILDALKNGAMGYILKDVPFVELAASLRAAMAGAVPISPSVVTKLVQRGGLQGLAAANGTAGPASDAADYQSLAMPEDEPVLHGLSDLGKREREILRLIGKGYDNAAIAGELFISEQTVKNYVYTIYTKLGEHSRIKVMQIAQACQRQLGT